MRRLKVGDQGGYVLIELIAAFAVVALVARLCAPMLPLGQRSSSVEAVSMDIANLLRDTRSLALAKASSETVRYDAGTKSLEGPDRFVRLGSDIGFSFESGPLCEGIPVLFRADGTNCGSILHISRGGRMVAIRVNWVDGGIVMKMGE